MQRFGNRMSDWYNNYHALINVSIVATAAQLADGLLNLSAIPPYVEKLHLTSQIGLVYAVFLISEAISRSPIGSLGDRIGRRSVYIFAALLGSGIAIGWSFANRLWVVLLLQAFSGIAFAGFYTSSVVTMAGAVGSERRTTAMAVFMITLLGGMSVGPLIGGFANDLADSKLVSFYIASGMFILTAILVKFLISHELFETNGQEESADIKSLLQGTWFGLKAVPDYLAIAFVIYFPVGMVLPIAKLFAMQQLHLSEAAYGAVFVIGAIIVGIISLGSEWFTGVWGKARTIHIGLGLALMGMYGLALIHITLISLIMAGIIGLGYIITLPSWLALISDMVDPDIRGSIIGAVGMGQGVGLIAGTILGGYLYERVSFSSYLSNHYVPFLISAFALTFSFLMALMVIRKDEGRHISHGDLYHD